MMQWVDGQEARWGVRSDRRFTDGTAACMQVRIEIFQVCFLCSFPFPALPAASVLCGVVDGRREGRERDRDWGGHVGSLVPGGA